MFYTDDKYQLRGCWRGAIRSVENASRWFWIKMVDLWVRTLEGPTVDPRGSSRRL